MSQTSVNVWVPGGPGVQDQYVDVRSFQKASRLRTELEATAGLWFQNQSVSLERKKRLVRSMVELDKFMEDKDWLISRVTERGIVLYLLPKTDDGQSGGWSTYPQQAERFAEDTANWVTNRMKATVSARLGDKTKQDLLPFVVRYEVCI